MQTRRGARLGKEMEILTRRKLFRVAAGGLAAALLPQHGEAESIVEVVQVLRCWKPNRSLPLWETRKVLIPADNIHDVAFRNELHKSRRTRFIELPISDPHWVVDLWAGNVDPQQRRAG